jgi:hypothetical protein
MRKLVRCPHGNHEFDAELPDLSYRQARYLQVRKDRAHSPVLCPQCKKPVNVPHWMIPELPNSPGQGSAEGKGS